MEKPSPGAEIDVLLVEDDPDIRESVTEMLTLSGLTVVAADDGKEALALARTCHPKVILTDMLMPRMNGAELARALRCDPALDSIPVLTMTGVTTTRRSASDVFVKPLDVERVVRTIQSHVSRRKAVAAI